MIEEYFTYREELIKTFVLIDAKVGPTDDDKLMLDSLREMGREVMVLITKVDKVKQAEIYKTTEKVKDLIGDFLIISSHKGTNINKLKAIISSHF